VADSMAKNWLAVSLAVSLALIFMDSVSAAYLIMVLMKHQTYPE